MIVRHRANGLMGKQKLIGPGSFDHPPQICPPHFGSQTMRADSKWCVVQIVVVKLIKLRPVVVTLYRQYIN